MRNQVRSLRDIANQMRKFVSDHPNHDLATVLEAEADRLDQEAAGLEGRIPTLDTFSRTERRNLVWKKVRDISTRRVFVLLAADVAVEDANTWRRGERDETPRPYARVVSPSGWFYLHAHDVLEVLADPPVSPFGAAWYAPSAAKHPTELLSTEDYESAPAGTVVGRDDCPQVLYVRGMVDWRQIFVGKDPRVSSLQQSSLMSFSLRPRRVLRWGTGESDV